MNEKFVNKSICFLGDSITEHGHYIYNIRSYFYGENKKVFVYNRGTGGARAITAKYILNDEIRELNPDYVVVCFGVNDMGIWLYDNNKPLTDELKEKRRVRNQEYYDNIKILVQQIKEQGIKPIIMSPFPVDEFLIEKENIQTLADNNEKEDYIGPSFYTRATFRNLNSALNGYAKNLKLLANELDALYIPLFETAHVALINEQGLFGPDGIHCTLKGHALIAKIVLSLFGCVHDELFFNKTNDNDEIFRLEQIERKAGFLLRNTFSKFYGEFDKSDIIKKAQELTLANEQWRRDVGNYYLKYGDKITDLRLKIIELTRAL